MRVEIDESGSDDQSACLYFASGARAGEGSDRDDAVAANADISGEPRVAGAIDDVSVANDEIVGSLACRDPGRAAGRNRHERYGECGTKISHRQISRATSCLVRR
jgi:hypothetical protein